MFPPRAPFFRSTRASREVTPASQARLRRPKIAGAGLGPAEARRAKARLPVRRRKCAALSAKLALKERDQVVDLFVGKLLAVLLRHDVRLVALRDLGVR